MALTKIRLGDYIVRSTVNNKDLKYGTELIAGVNNQGVFTTPKGNTDGVDLQPYKIVNNGAFVYNPTRLDLGSIAYRTEGLCIVSHLYMIFYLTEEGKKIIDPEWLFIYFRRKEFCREVTFRNFGSQRPEFNFNDMSDIEIPLPDIEIQHKYVAVYNSMLANQKSYERGLDDLKLTCDASIENIRKQYQSKSLKSLLTRRNERNDDMNATYLGISKDGFINPKQELSDGNILHKKKFYYDDFIFTPSGVNIHNKTYKTAVCSHVNEMFFCNDDSVLSDYIELWLKRNEFLRYCDFYNISSVMANFNYDTFSDYFIPIPPVELQRSVIDIYNAYMERKSINERLKNQIQDICPILIKGSIEEARKEA